MEGTHLQIAADRLNQLADEIDGFTTNVSERAAGVASEVREVAVELSSMAEAVSGTTGTVETTPPDSVVTVDPDPDPEPTA